MNHKRLMKSYVGFEEFVITLYFQRLIVHSKIVSISKLC